LKQPTPQRLKAHYRQTKYLAGGDATDRICNPEQEHPRFAQWEAIGGIGPPRSTSVQVGELGEKVTSIEYMGLGENRILTPYSLHAVRGVFGAEIQRCTAQFSPGRVDASGSPSSSHPLQISGTQHALSKQTCQNPRLRFHCGGGSALVCVVPSGKGVVGPRHRSSS
jgi:hypothetical protein